MGVESCNLPDNTSTNLDIQIPSELKGGVVDETKTELINCFIESLKLQSGSDVFLRYFQEQIRKYVDIDRVLSSEYIIEIIRATLHELGNSEDLGELEEFIDLANIDYKSYLVINGVSINFTAYFDEQQIEKVMNILYDGGNENIEDGGNIEKNEEGLFVGISDRSDINSRKFFGRIDFLISNSQNNIGIENGEQILVEGFKIAFGVEMQGPFLGKGITEFRKSHDSIRDTFRENISGISTEYIDRLMFLSVVESNFNPNVKSGSGAIGLWQIMPSTGRKYYSGELSIEDALRDPVTSTNIASRYLNDVIQDVRAKFPNATDEQIFKITLREYNGAWSARLKPQYRKDVFNTARNIYLQLDTLEGIRYDNRISEQEKIKEAKSIISAMQEEYFDNSDLIGYIEKHGRDKSFTILYVWSKRYFDKIVKQQLMYPNQVMGAHDAFHELYSS